MDGWRETRKEWMREKHATSPNLLHCGRPCGLPSAAPAACHPRMPGPPRADPVPARSSDHFYDRRGQQAHYKPCHNTAGIIYCIETPTTQPHHKVYQGGIYRSQDLNFLQEKGHRPRCQLHSST